MIRRVLLGALLMLLPVTVWAACTGPAGIEGNIVYNAPYHTPEFCNGSQWVTMSGGSTVYSAGGSTNPTFAASNGYFVLTAGTFTGNLGGLSGANASCLTDLTNNNWNGKSAAQGFGILNASHVFAYLCDGNTCQSPTASKNYYYANASDATAGGSYFVPDSGSAFGYTGNSNTSDGVQWSALSVFNTNASYWTNRQLYQFAFITNPSSGGGNTASNCQGFTTASSASSAVAGISTSSATQRVSNNNPNCAATLRLLCMVNP